MDSKAVWTVPADSLPYLGSLAAVLVRQGIIYEWTDLKLVHHEKDAPVNVVWARLKNMNGHVEDKQLVILDTKVLVTKTRAVPQQQVVRHKKVA